MTEAKKPLGIRIVLFLLISLLIGYLVSSCDMMTAKSVASVANTSWWSPGKHYLYFNDDLTGIYDDSVATHEFTFTQKDGYIQAYYDDVKLEMTRLKDAKLFLLNETMFFYPHET